MRNTYSFAIGFAAGALDALGWLKARNIVYRAPVANHGRKIDGFDSFYSIVGR